MNKKALFLGTQVWQVTQAFTPSQEWNLALDSGPWHSHFTLLHQPNTDFKLNSSNFKEALQCCHFRFHGARPPATGSVWDPSRSLQHIPAAPSMGSASVLQQSPEQTGDQKTVYHALFGYHWGLGPITLIQRELHARTECSAQGCSWQHCVCGNHCHTHDALSPS